jgi:hypothetical protein
MIGGVQHIHHGLILTLYVIGIGPCQSRIHVSGISAEGNNLRLNRKGLIASEIYLPSTKHREPAELLSAAQAQSHFLSLPVFPCA